MLCGVELLVDGRPARGSLGHVTGPRSEAQLERNSPFSLLSPKSPLPAFPFPAGTVSPEKGPLGTQASPLPAPRHSWSETRSRLSRCPPHAPLPAPLHPRFPLFSAWSRFFFHLGPFALAVPSAREALPPGVCQAGPSSPSAPPGAAVCRGLSWGPRVSGPPHPPCGVSMGFSPPWYFSLAVSQLTFRLAFRCR